MVERLSVKIALEGGKEIERQLEGIGEAGQKAFADIAKSAEAVGGFKNLKPEEVTAKLKDMGVVGTEAFNKIRDAVASAARLESVVESIGRVEQAVVALARGFGLLVLVVGAAAKEMTSAAEAIGKINAEAAKLGLSIEKFDAMRMALEQAGLSAKGVSEAIGKVQSDVEKVNLDNLKKAISDVETALKKDLGPSAIRKQFAEIEQAATQAGAAGKLAREFLEKIGAPIPNSAAKTLDDIRAAGGSTNEVLANLVRAFQQMPDSVERSRLAVETFGQTAGPQLIAAIRSGSIPAIDEFIAKQGVLTQATVDSAAEMEAAMNRGTAARQRFLDTMSWDTFAAAAKATAIEVATAFQQMFQPLIDASNKLDATVWDAFKSAGTAAMGAIQAAAQATLDVFNATVKVIWDAVEALAKFLGMRPGGGSGAPAPSGQGFAGGGLLGGRGSGTSDSNLAWVSRGEHIMPARAVGQPGVLAFLEALRRSGGNLRRVLDGMGRFALGGPVAMPAIGGGLGGMSNVTIQFPGLPTIGGLRASADVVAELQKAAAMAQVRSGGRKPSRYR